METLVLAAIALAIVALSRTGARGKLAQRIDRLEAEVAWLRAALAGERPAEVPGAALGDAEAPTTGATADTDIAAARPTAPSGWPPAAPPAPEPGDARRARPP